MAETLDAIGLRHGTDKASTSNDYLSFYARYLEPLRQSATKVLEIGVLDGASLRTWRDYFPNATIIGADINPDARRHADDRISIEIADQSKDGDLGRLARLGPFDLIVDDGSHFWRHQIRTFQLLAGAARGHGFYVLEDLDTSYGRHALVYGGGRSAADYLRELTDWVVGYRQMGRNIATDPYLREIWPMIEFIAFWQGTALMQKRLTPRVVPEIPRRGPAESAVLFLRRVLRACR